MTVHDGEAYLPDQLASIAGQTRPPDRLVVFDDCSGDRSPGILRGFAELSPFEVVVLASRKARLGSPAAFERALSDCRGDLIAVCDQDDVWGPGRLRRFEAEFLAADPPAAAFCDADLIDGDGGAVGESLWGVLGTRNVLGAAPPELVARSLARPSIPGCILAFSGHVRDLALPFPQALRDAALDIRADGWLLALAGAAGRVTGIDERLMSYRVHPTQQIGLGQRVRGADRRRALGVLRDHLVVERDLAQRIGAAELVRRRLASRLPTDQAGECVATLDEMLCHLRRRQSLPAGRFARVPALAGELSSGRYARYSSGARSAAVDLVRFVPERPLSFRGSPRERPRDHRHR